MCVTLTSNYLTCGHSTFTHTPCLTDLNYTHSLSPQYCTHTSHYTAWNTSICDDCNIITGREILPQLDPASPLVWMNNVYRASLKMKPEPRDVVVDDGLKIAIYNEGRKKGCRVVKRKPTRGDHVPLDVRVRVIDTIGCLLPADIQKD